MINKEIWKPVLECDSKIHISNMGNIKSFKRSETGVIYSVPKENVYFSFQYRGKNYLVHRLVAAYFIENPMLKATVNHINGLKNDNRVENLEWATQSENNYHAINEGLRDMPKFGNSACSKYVFKYSTGGELVAKYESVTMASIENKVNKNAISNCCRGVSQSCVGYIWSYLELSKDSFPRVIQKSKSSTGLRRKVKLDEFFIPRKDYECPLCFCHIGEFAFRQKDRSVICYECWHKANPPTEEEKQRQLDELPF